MRLVRIVDFRRSDAELLTEQDALGQHPHGQIALCFLVFVRRCSALARRLCVWHKKPVQRHRDSARRVGLRDAHLLDAKAGTLEVLVDADAFAARHPAEADLSANDFGLGRELFATFRRVAGPADQGASVFG